MSRALFLTFALFFALSGEALRAARLAIIVEDPRLSAEADLLTTELSKRSDLELLEREQILKIRKEQSLVAVHGTDYLKLGNLLGADGVLILDVLEETTRLLVSVRLAAVNPGVLLDVAEYDFPAREPQEAPIARPVPATIGSQGSSAGNFGRRSLADSQEWCRLLVQHLDPLLPKLGVLVKEAVPISTLNIRSAAKTPQSSTIEQQLKFLLFQRLARQKEIFLLEREKLLTLAEEKSQAGPPDSPFWNGGYLLEAVIDRAGFNTNVLTLSVRLSPPARGSSFNFEVSGPRTNLAAVIDNLAPQLLGALKTMSPAVEWNSRQEAERYFEEAKWALRWEMLREAVTAAEAAWALGKADSNCAVLRVENCAKLASVSPDFWHDRMYDRMHRKWVPLAADPKIIRWAVGALAAYRDFSVTLPADGLRPDSPWYSLGIQSLESASQVLQLFHHFPKAELEAATRLAELRDSAREVSDLIVRSPAVRDLYWGTSRVFDQGQLHNLLDESPSIFKCALDYGCFWQERPEDTIELYRDLMRAPVFYFVHSDLYQRAPHNPALVAWNEGDEARVPSLWKNFIEELGASTNAHMRIEADFLRLANETTDSARETIFNRLYQNLFEPNPPSLTNTVPFRYMLCAGSLSGRAWFAWENMPHDKDGWLGRIWGERAARLQAAENEASFEAQKQYLRNNSPFDQLTFQQTFRFLYYSAAQAVELKPLLASYKSNLVAQAASQAERGTVTVALQALSTVEQYVWRMVPSTEISAIQQPATQTPAGRAPPSPIPLSQLYTNSGRPKSAIAPSIAKQPGADTARAASIPGTTFHPITQSLVQNAPESSVIVRGHRVSDNKLWLELRYGNRREWHSAIAVFDPGADAWEVFRCPGKTDNTVARGQPVFLGGEPESSLCFQPFGGALYISQWTEPLRKFDLKTRRWEILPIPVEKPTQLFSINARLYGANDEAIFEILEGGHSTRLLASSRRRPVSSRLDSFHSLGEVILFPGTANSVRAFVGGKVFAWDGQDWNQTAAFHNASPPSIFEDAALFRCQDPSASLWLLPHTQNQARLCWRDQRPAPDSSSGRTRLSSLTSERSNDSPTPLWKTPLQLSGNTAVGALHSNLCIVSPHVIRSNFVADLTWLGRGEALTLHLRLGESDRCFFNDASRPFELAAYSYTHPWVEFTGNALILGHGRWNGVWTIPQTGVATALALEQKRLPLSESGILDLKK